LNRCSHKSDLQKSLEALNQGEYAQAIKSLNRAAAKEPANPQVYYGFCIAYANLDSITQTLRYYLKLNDLGSNLKDDISLKGFIANFLKIEPYPSSPIPMKKIRNQFKGSPAPGHELIAVAAAKLDVADIYLVKYDGEIIKKISKGGMNTDPDFAMTGDKVVYVSNRDGDDELYVYDLKTEQTVKLTDNKFQDNSPSVSPDGKEVVYVSDMDGTWEIYRINLISKKIARLTSNKYWDGFPSFTSDGAWVVFSSSRNGSDDIYTMRADGTETRVLYASKADDTDPHLVGDNLFFRSTRDGEWEIYRMTMKNKLLVRLTNNSVLDWNPRVSKDGLRLLLSRKIGNRWQLYFINLASSIPSEVVLQAVNTYLMTDRKN